MISIPVAVHTDNIWGTSVTFKMQLDLFWFNHQLTYGAQASERARAIIIKRNFLTEAAQQRLTWPIDVPHIMCEAAFDLLPRSAGLHELGFVASPLNIQLGLSQILPTMDDEQLIELLDCDMFHFRPAPPMAVGDDELIVCDFYENWHLKSLTDNKHVIEAYFKNGGRYYNGGFVPIIGKVKTFRKILADWTDLHIDILQQDQEEDTHWWAGMFALQAACERAGVTMIARDICYIPGANPLHDAHYLCHYSVDTRFNKKTYPDIDVSTFEQNIFYERILLWLQAREAPALSHQHALDKSTRTSNTLPAGDVDKGSGVPLIAEALPINPDQIHAKPGIAISSKKLNNTLIFIAGILNKEQVPDWYIAYGTLLGVVRAGSCIDGDDDIDINIAADFSRLKSMLIKYGFEFDYGLGIGDNKTIIKTRATDSLASIDFYICTVSHGDFYSAWEKTLWRDCYLDKHLKTFHTRLWNNVSWREPQVTLNLPKNYIKKLEARYGDWEVPSWEKNRGPSLRDLP